MRFTRPGEDHTPTGGRSYVARNASSIVIPRSLRKGVAQRGRCLLRRDVVDERPHPGLGAGEVLQLVPVTPGREEPKKQGGEVAAATYGGLVPRRDVGHRDVEEPVE